MPPFDEIVCTHSNKDAQKAKIMYLSTKYTIYDALHAFVDAILHY